MRPGIRGPAALKYRNEEELLAVQEDPERYNREVIYPDKVRINREYIENKYPPAEPEVLRLLAPQRGLTAIG